MAERRLDGLTSLRFFACLLVVLFHYGVEATSHVPILGPVVRVGNVGVSFFFVLSGFVLTAVYGSKPGRLDRRRFYVARFARIVPAYALAILATLVFYATALRIAHPADWLRPALIALALRATFLSAWVPGYAIQLNVPCWTLSAEAFFYALYPAVLAGALRASPTVRRVVVAAVLGAGLLVPTLAHRLAPSVDPASFDHTAYYLPLFHLGSFLVGVEAGLLYLGSPTPIRRDAIGVVASLLAVGLVVACARAIPESLLQCGLLAVPFGVIVLGVARNDARLGLLRWAPLVLLGEASYAAYLFQEPAFGGLVWTFGRMGRAGSVGGPVFVLLHLGLLGGVALAVHRIVEVPSRRWLRSRLEPPGSPESRTVASGVVSESSRES